MERRPQRRENTERQSSGPSNDYWTGREGHGKEGEQSLVPGIEEWQLVVPSTDRRRAETSCSVWGMLGSKAYGTPMWTCPGTWICKRPGIEPETEIVQQISSATAVHLSIYSELETAHMLPHGPF